MKKQFILLLSILSVLFAGCSDQKATATRQRWMEIKTATDNLREEMELANQSTPLETEDPFTESLAQVTSNLNAFQKYNEALSSQKTVNVDSKLNALAEKFITSSDSLITQFKRVQNAFITAQRLSRELETTVDPQRQQQISLEANKVQSEIESFTQTGSTTWTQISSHYQELEELRLELNKQYGFELPQIKWMDQQ